MRGSVLIVDDDQAISTIVAEVLSEEGSRWLSATAGRPGGASEAGGPEPLSYWRFSAVQALAFLWVSTARWPKRLLRLHADCVRTLWEPEMSDEPGDRLLPADGVGDERVDPLIRWKLA